MTVTIQQLSWLYLKQQSFFFHCSHCPTVEKQRFNTVVGLWSLAKVNPSQPWMLLASKPYSWLLWPDCGPCNDKINLIQCSFIYTLTGLALSPTPGDTAPAHALPAVTELLSWGWEWCQPSPQLLKKTFVCSPDLLEFRGANGNSGIWGQWPTWTACCHSCLCGDSLAPRAVATSQTLITPSPAQLPWALLSGMEADGGGAQQEGADK